MKLKKFKKKLDPRKYNGAIFLGLQGPVVKSHGATDSLGFAYSIEMCNKIVEAELIEQINDEPGLASNWLRMARDRVEANLVLQELTVEAIAQMNSRTQTSIDSSLEP